MNKRDIEKLAMIVARMTTEYSSERQTVLFGEEIANAFPALKPTLEIYVDVAHGDNFTKMMVDRLIKLHTSIDGHGDAHRRYYNELHPHIDSVIYYICDSYCELKVGEAKDFAAELDGLNWPDVLKRIISDPSWVASVGDHLVDKNSNLYRILTGTYLIS